MFVKAQDKQEADFYNLLFAKNEETYCLDEKDGKIFAVKKVQYSIFAFYKYFKYCKIFG